MGSIYGNNLKMTLENHFLLKKTKNKQNWNKLKTSAVAEVGGVWRGVYILA